MNIISNPQGSQVCATWERRGSDAGAINHFCEIGDGIVFINASIDHECILGPGVHVMGAAAIAGRVTIRSTASIG